MSIHMDFCIYPPTHTTHRHTPHTHTTHNTHAHTAPHATPHTTQGARSAHTPPHTTHNTAQHLSYFIKNPKARQALHEAQRTQRELDEAQRTQRALHEAHFGLAGSPWGRDL